MPDDEILSHRRVALLELVQKHIRTRDMLELAADIARLLNLWAIPKEQFRSLMYYIVGRGETSDTRQFLHTIAAQTQDYQEDVMTIAEQLRQEGEQRGILKGRQEGLQEGEKLASLKIAQQLLANGAERHLIKIATGLSDNELDDLSMQ
ncbi:ISNCY family transposase ISPlu15 [Sodalis praecaptivus]|nr:ISNCY family transposase ISPlu15 [Sodalis praecaptivus]